MPVLLRKKEEEEKRQRVAQRMQRQLNSIITDENGGYGRCAETVPDHSHHTLQCITGNAGQACLVKADVSKWLPACHALLEDPQVHLSLQHCIKPQASKPVGAQGAAGAEADRLLRERLRQHDAGGHHAPGAQCAGGGRAQAGSAARGPVSLPLHHSVQSQEACLMPACRLLHQVRDRVQVKASVLRWAEG